VANDGMPNCKKRSGVSTRSRRINYLLLLQLLLNFSLLLTAAKDDEIQRVVNICDGCFNRLNNVDSSNFSMGLAYMKWN